MSGRVVALAVIAVALIGGPRQVAAQPKGQRAPQAALRIDGREAYVGMPFVLSMVVEGFDGDPPPQLPSLAIPGIRVAALGATPNVTMIQINGQRMDQVTWLLRWRLEADRAGEFTVPAMTVTQGAKKATTQPAKLRIGELPTTDDMQLEVILPNRPVWVGETITVPIHWMLRRNPEDQAFSIPLLSMDDTFAVAAPPVTNPRQALQLSAGSRDLQVPFARDDVTLGGKQYARFVFEVLVTPKRAGTIEIPAASVAATLEVSGRRDFFGNAPTKLFRVADRARTLDVKPLPQTGRPPAFAGAVGQSFSIGVRASRSVVQLGEPVDLEITIRGDQRLDTLALGALVGDGGLPRDKFAAPDQPPPGELSDDGRTKSFKVPVQVIGPATEIPAIAFAYFDPTKATYQTVRSEPIALSVKGGNVVGAGDVVAIQKDKKPAAGGGGLAPGELSLVGADLALSPPDSALSRPLGGAAVWIAVALLYLVPLTVLGLRIHRTRTRTRRAEASEVTAARRAFEYELSRAATAPAREVVGPLVGSVRTLARALGAELDDLALLARLETEAFAPNAASAPLSAAQRDELLAAVKQLLAAPARTPARRGSGTSAALVLVAIGALASDARADALAEGRAAYQDAMAANDPAVRRADFGEAAERLARAVAEHPGSPELLADWGNAALGKGDVATATLAYRRALAIDGSNERAERNLGWLRSKQADDLRVRGGGATDTLFFFHSWPRPRRLLVGAIAFAIAVVLVMPWRGRRHRGLTALALAPAAVWIAMLVSALFEDRRADDAVVMDAAVLRAADSAGAPAARAQPLPPGTEITIVERRDTWFRVRLASGATGWLPAGTLQTVL